MSETSSAPLRADGKAPPCTLVVFGAAGDMAKRLLMPAISLLARQKLLNEDFNVLGVDIADNDDERFRVLWRQAAGADAQDCAGPPANRIAYLKGDFGDVATFEHIAARLRGGGNAIFYLATAPQFFATIVEALAHAKLTDEPDRVFRRVVIEKPFGTDYESARALNARIRSVLREDQIYRIDHFLGKETVRNILVTRFGNAAFEPLWCAEYIDHVQISAAETVGVEQRAHYYDKTGALRDMTPNHLMQILALIAMERPTAIDASAIRAQKNRALAAIRLPAKEEALGNSVRGQYAAGAIEGRPVRAYRNEANVPAHSETETYVALKLAIDNERWRGAPFYLRTGKSLRARDTEVALHFRPLAHTLFGADLGASTLVLQIQPEEGISLLFAAKRPGLDMTAERVRMDFRYRDYFQIGGSSGYETLLYDCMIGDQTLFPDAEGIEAGWRAVMPFLAAWRGSGAPEPYAAGSDGPAASDALLARDGRHWRAIGGAA